jgi:hypothetical protein
VSCSGSLTYPRWMSTSPSSRLLMDHESIDGQDGFWLPFGYYLERDADLLVLRRSDDSLVAAFSAEGVDLFEVE